MITKSKFRGLHQPKVTPITKQQYRKFYFIRKLSSETLGQHELLSHNHKKYISKDFPLSASFLTLRPQNQQIFHYSEQGNNKYIFQIIGQPLCDIWRNRQGQEIKDWTERCHGFEGSMIELIKFCVKMYESHGIEDILYECFRISDGKIYYCYDSWMRSTYEIVAHNSLDIQNYFLSEIQLSELLRSNTEMSVNLTYKQFLFKIGLFIISLVLPELKIRNYEYCQFTLNKANIEEKLKTFKIKISNKQLYDLVSKFINHQIQTMDQVWKLVTSGSRHTQPRGQSPSIYTATSGVKMRNNSKQHCEKENSILINDTSHTHHIRKASSNTAKIESLLLPKTQGSTSKKIRLKSRSGAINESINYSLANIYGEQQKQTKTKKQFNFKQLFSKPPPADCSIKILEYLGLTQYITQSIYESAVLNALEGIRVKPEWKHKIYANGSIYLGQLVGERREGKGMYLFDSEDLYIGQWSENAIHGYGVYVFRSGQSYLGHLKRGLKQGFGRFCYKDGRIFQGHWEQNFKYGFGTVQFPNGVKFLGFFQKTNETFGLFTCVKGQQLVQFQGLLQNYNWQTNSFSNVQISQQILKNKLKKCKIESYIPFLKDQGTKYYGEYSEGKPNGFGIKQSQTEIYEGSWRNGKEDGNGKLTIKNKFEVLGTWQQGILVEYKLT